MKPLIILKIGGSLITNKSASKPVLNKKVLKRIAKEISSAFEKIKDNYSLIIVHGAGSFGHVIVKKTGIHEGIKNESQLLSMAETQRLQNLLNCYVTEQLIKNKVPAFPFQASSNVVMENGIKTMDLDALKGLLNSGLVPVSFGTPNYNKKQICSILSGDDIVPYIASKIETVKIIYATDVDGVYDSNPHENKKAKLITEIKSMKDINITGSSNIDVTGGMYGKISKIFSINKKLECFIINGSKKENIEKCLKNDNIECTKITIK